MGTFFTFTTELCRDKDKADQLTKSIKAEDEGLRDFHRLDQYNNKGEWISCYFVGSFKESHPVPITLYSLQIGELRTAWLNDEGRYGIMGGDVDDTHDG